MTQVLSELLIDVLLCYLLCHVFIQDSVKLMLLPSYESTESIPYTMLSLLICVYKLVVSSEITGSPWLYSILSQTLQFFFSFVCLFVCFCFVFLSLCFYSLGDKIMCLFVLLVGWLLFSCVSVFPFFFLFFLLFFFPFFLLFSFNLATHTPDPGSLLLIYFFVKVMWTSYVSIWKHFVLQTTETANPQENQAT